MYRGYSSHGMLMLVCGVCMVLSTCTTAPRYSRRTRAPVVMPARGASALHNRQNLRRWEGTASYYGAEFHGKKTASGVRYNMNAFTAAHRTLPFGTKVRVSNLDNGRSRVVVVNDRGPYKRGRIIDVSYGAARALGMLKTGTARVRIEVLR